MSMHSVTVWEYAAKYTKPIETTLYVVEYDLPIAAPMFIWDLEGTNENVTLIIALIGTELYSNSGRAWADWASSDTRSEYLTRIQKQEAVL